MHIQLARESLIVRLGACWFRLGASDIDDAYRKKKATVASLGSQQSCRTQWEVAMKLHNNMKVQSSTAEAALNTVR